MTDSYKFGGTLSRRLFTLGLVATGTLISGKKAYAHRERYTLTEVEWEDNPGSLYVTHSFHVHETEDVLYKAGVLHKPDLYSLKSRAQLALYASINHVDVKITNTVHSLTFRDKDNVKSISV